jgi:hypothetical protein
MVNTVHSGMKHTTLSSITTPTLTEAAVLIEIVSMPAYLFICYEVYTEAAVGSGAVE